MELMTYIKRTGYILLVGTSCMLVAAEKDQSSTPYGQEEKVSKSLIRPLLSAGIVTGVATWVAYKTSPFVRESIDSSCEKVKIFFLHSVGPRVLLKVEKIKDEGLKGSDGVRIVCVVGSCYIAKKLFDFFHIKDLLEGDSSMTKEALLLCKKEYKKILLGSGAASVIGYLVWLAKQDTHLFDKLQLSAAQRAQCSQSTELSVLVREKDFSSLLEHEDFMPLLNDKQREIRQLLLEEYGRDYSLHLLDDME